MSPDLEYDIIRNFLFAGDYLETHWFPWVPHAGPVPGALFCLALTAIWLAGVRFTGKRLECSPGEGRAVWLPLRGRWLGRALAGLTLAFVAPAVGVLVGGAFLTLFVLATHGFHTEWWVGNDLPYPFTGTAGFGALLGVGFCEAATLAAFGLRRWGAAVGLITALLASGICFVVVYPDPQPETAIGRVLLPTVLGAPGEWTLLLAIYGCRLLVGRTGMGKATRKDAVASEPRRQIA